MDRKKIIRLRERRGWDQKQLADYLGVHRTTVNRLENGKVVPKGAVAKMLMALEQDQKQVELLQIATNR